MSGVRVHNYRQGDRSEYLAVYLLSGLGLVTQVPRQEDIGFDLICNLAEQESGTLSFRHHFAVSVKSVSTPRVVLDPPESKKDDVTYRDHFNWLFHLELPLMLAVVNKEKQELALYSTLPAWFLFHGKLDECGVIELVPRTEASASTDGVDVPRDCGAEPKAGGRKRFEVDLGFPVTVVSTNDLEDKELLKAKKHSLRRAIELGTQSAQFARMGIPFFSWFNVTVSGGFISGRTNPDGYNGGTAWYVQTCQNSQQLNQLMSAITPGLMSLALLFKGTNQPEKLMALRDVMRLLPPGSVPPAVRERIPEIFDAN